MKEKLLAKFNKHFSEVLTLIVLSLMTVIGGAYFNKKMFVLGIFLIAVYVGAYFLIRMSRRGKSTKNHELFTNITVELLMEMKMPVAILDSAGAILWYNQSFADKCDEKTLYNTKINDLLETRLNINHLKESLDGESLEASFCGAKYRVDSYMVKSGIEEFYITVWHDRTEIEILKEKIDALNPVVAYIYVDNSTDVSSYMNSNYRAATAKISGILNSWISSMNGILREFDRDKYIALFDKSYLKNITDTKCEVLDTVREVSEDCDIAVSISMGIACLENSTFSEKEQVAHQALDLAMQRGGDQAVLRYDDSADYYGGRFKSVQKRTKIRSRFIANEIIKLLKNCSNVIIMGHKFADHDSVGSCIGMAAFALEYCKKVNVVVNGNDDNVRAILDKTKKIPKFANLFIDASNGQDLIESGTLLLICDVNNPAIFEAPDIYKNVKDVVIIDHHRKTGEFIIEPLITYIEPSASSASELVSEILEQAFKPGTLLKEEAEVLFAGIVLDTKGFTKNTGVRTFSAAYYLRGEGAVPAEIEEYFKTTFADFKSEAKFENSVVIYRERVAITMLDGEATQSDKVNASKVADRLMGIGGIEASFALCKIDDTTYISARSNGNINVQLILEKLNGGGHYDAAGAQVKNDGVDAVLLRLRDAIDNYLDNM